ncbi:MAG TPA: hypothetical protein VFQ38_18460 [Longimicrobiales bacterium]|nr:hypothetical protein [Longimicrobiales bacterium]
MRVVGIKQLKARLSEYLRDVRRGEVFLVTDRDEVVAELRPPRPGALPEEERGRDLLELLVETGEVAPPRLPKGDWVWKPTGAGLPATQVDELLDWLRADRDAS